MSTLTDRPSWLGGRDELDVIGPDATKYLQSQLSQDLRSVVDGQRVWSLLLDPNGKVVAVVGVTRHDAERWTVDVDAGWLDAVSARLRRFMIRVRAELTERPAVDPDEPNHAQRIEAAWPAMGAEITPGVTIPAELGITEATVSFTKGCYPGQELVERMDARQAAARRHLVVVDVPVEATVGDTVGRHASEHGPVLLTSVSGTRALGYAGRAPSAGSSSAATSGSDSAASSGR